MELHGSSIIALNASDSTVCQNACRITFHLASEFRENPLVCVTIGEHSHYHNSNIIISYSSSAECQVVRSATILLQLAAHISY